MDFVNDIWIVIQHTLTEIQTVREVYKKKCYFTFT